MEGIEKLEKDSAGRTYGYYKKIEDGSEAIAFLRARIINLLINKSSDVFMEHRNEILNGSFNDTLIDHVQTDCGALRSIQEISLQRIYQHQTVIEIEIAGYNVMSELLGLLIPALLKARPSHKEQKALRLFPYQFTEFEQTDSNYKKALNALDFLSGMTDEYATEMYRRLKGIVIPRHD